MKTDWDYTTLADAYLTRPDYADNAIEEMLRLCGTSSGSSVCDVGAGVAHLTLMLARRGLNVTAVEPNDAMRANGITRTRGLENVVWFEGTGEATGQSPSHFDLVTFGSSFNVCDRIQALAEANRILKSRGWFACMWNHRDLDDPIQSAVETIIKSMVPDYAYGTRREDQTDVIDASGWFEPSQTLHGQVRHAQSVSDWVAAWRSHGTLARQAGDAFPDVIAAIEDHLTKRGDPMLSIPYTTRIWIAQKKA